MREFGEVSDSRVFGRDASNLYYDLVYYIAKELRSDPIAKLETCPGKQLDIILQTSFNVRDSTLQNYHKVVIIGVDPELVN